MPHDSGWQVLHVHRQAPPKPVFGAPCNGCGLCCLAEPCPLGMVVSRRRHGACDALRFDKAASRYRCGMMTEPAEILGRRWRWLAPLVRRLARRWISAGSGCDSTIEPS
ncbi:MAG: hypothetical protein ABIW85_04350 [Variovorax sp.]